MSTHLENLDLHTLKVLNHQVDEVFAIWRNAQREYLTAVHDLAEAKFHLARAIDVSYTNGDVYGKNEREREAQLRQLHPDLYKGVEELERKVRLIERTLRDAEIAGEQVRLQVTIAKCANAFFAVG